MAYNTTTDYKALQDALKKQRDATTGVTEKYALQSQIDAAEQSRTEKLASDLTAYGKYATDSELNNAAGIMAQNQLGTGYDTQRANLNRSFDTARQNANNEALSRGMARSSFVQDRLSGLDTDRATALQGVDASQAMALQNARANIISDYRANSANALANEKKEYGDTIGAYYGDYQAETDKVTGDNDPSNDWKIPYLQAARNQKLQAQQAAALEAARYADKMAAKGSSGGGSRGGGGSSMTYSQLSSAMKTMYENGADNDAMYNYLASYGGQYADQLAAMYGIKDNVPKAAAKLNDSAASYQVGMNRGAEGQKATVKRLLDAGQITETQAERLLKNHGLL